MRKRGLTCALHVSAVAVAIPGRRDEVRNRLWLRTLFSQVGTGWGKQRPLGRDLGDVVVERP